MKVVLMQLWAIGEMSLTDPPTDQPPADPPPAEKPPAGPPATPPGWVAQLPTDLRSDESLTKFKTIGELAQDYRTTKGRLVELDGKVSKMVPKLPESPTEDDLKSYRGAMGIPETPDKYEIKRVQWPEKLGPYPEQVEKSFKEVAHSANYTPEQVQKAYDWYMRSILSAGSNMDEVAQRRRKEAEEELKKDWGDDYSTNTDQATRAFFFYADPDDVEYFEKTGFADNPRVIKLFHRIFLQTANDRMVRSSRPPSPSKDKPITDAYGRTRLSYPSMEKKG